MSITIETVEFEGRTDTEEYKEAKTKLESKGVKVHVNASPVMLINGKGYEQKMQNFSSVDEFVSYIETNRCTDLVLGFVISQYKTYPEECYDPVERENYTEYVLKPEYPNEKIGIYTRTIQLNGFAQDIPFSSNLEFNFE